MNEHYLRKLLGSPDEVNVKIDDYMSKGVLVRHRVSESEISGHIAKSEHNLDFVGSVIGSRFNDWALVGCYYACYHAALALVIKCGLFSKSHDATLCMLIKHYYGRGMSEDDILLVNRNELDSADILFYTEAKNEREKASYSTAIAFDPGTVKNIRMKSILFVDKCKGILGE